jgi:hypothetical protein
MAKQTGILRSARVWLDKCKKQLEDMETAMGIPSVIDVNAAIATITSNVT